MFYRRAKYHNYIFLIVLFATASTALAQKWADDMFQTRSYDFGNVSQYTKAEYSFQLYNPYIENIEISSVSSSCGCTTVTTDKKIVKTYETANILAHFNTDRFTGSRNATLTVTISKPYFAVVQLQVRGNIRGDVLFNPGSIEFGNVAQGDGAEKLVNVNYAGYSNWEIKETKCKTPCISTEIIETARQNGRVSYQLKVKLAKKTPAGYINERIYLHTSEGAGREIPLMVQGNVRAAITASPSPLYIGNVTSGKEVVKSLVVRGDKPFEIKEIKSSSNQFEFKIPANEGNGTRTRTVHVVSVIYHAADEITQEQTIQNIIEISTDSQQKPIEIISYVTTKCQ